jgi:hypothetical protein
MVFSVIRTARRAALAVVVCLALLAVTEHQPSPARASDFGTRGTAALAVAVADQGGPSVGDRHPSRPRHHLRAHYPLAFVLAHEAQLRRSDPRLLFQEPWLMREDPQLRFVFLAVPRDPELAVSPALAAVSRAVLRLRIDGQWADIVVPDHPNGRVVLFEHGSDQSANYEIDTPRSERLIVALAAAGYGFAESDADFNNWGNRASLDVDLALAQWLRAHGATSIDLGGDSMGGLDATQLIPFVHPQAVFELFPVCDEASVAHLFAIDMRYAHAPVRALSPVQMRDVTGLPMLFTASDEDTIVLKSENADVCAAEARAAGAEVDEVTTVGEHDDPSNWTPGRILTFLAQAATPSS